MSNAKGQVVSRELQAQQQLHRSFKTQMKLFKTYLKRAIHPSKGDIEHVHQLRVSGRRLLAAISVVALIAKQKDVSWLKRRVREIVRAAGKARDLDLMIRDEMKRGTQCDRRLLKLWKRRREAAQDTLCDLHRRLKRSSRLRMKTRALCEAVRKSEGRSGKASERRFREWCVERMADSAKPFIEGLLSARELESIHQLRIDGKRFRYTLELLGPYLDEFLTCRVYEEMKNLQEALGELQDRVVAREHLTRTASKQRNGRKSSGSDLSDVWVGRIAALDQQIAIQLTAFLKWQASSPAAQLVQDVGDLCKSEQTAEES